MTPRVLVTIPSDVPVLEGVVQVVRGAVGSTPSADALLVGPTDRIGANELEKMPHLRVVAVAAAGTDAVDVDELRRRNIVLVNAPEATTTPTAEIALCLLLMVSRGIKESVAELESRRWRGWSFDHVIGRDIANLTLGLVGYGRIGRRVAHLAQAFGMDVLHYCRTDTGEPGYRASLHALLAESDVISLHLPLTDETVGMISAEVISRMRTGAALVNTSRGGLVDEGALCDALTSGHLSGAGLDVFADEPKIPEKLFGLPNLVVTPHIGTSTVRAREAMANEAATNLVRELREALVNKARRPGLA